jgi:hypothetical protein
MGNELEVPPTPIRVNLFFYMRISTSIIIIFLNRNINKFSTRLISGPVKFVKIRKT